MVEYVPSKCFSTRFRAAVNVLVGPCCPALFNCIDEAAYTTGGSVLGLGAQSL